MARLIGPVSNSTKQFFEQNTKELANLEKKYGRTISLGENRSQLLINSGVRTSVVDKKAISSGKDMFAKDMFTYIRQNCDVNEVGKTKIRSSKFLNWFKNLF